MNQCNLIYFRFLCNNGATNYLHTGNKANK